MALAMKPIEDAILARLEELPQTVYDNEVPDGETPPRNVDGTILPYINVYFGGPRQAGTGRGIVGTRHNTNVAYCTVQISGQRSSDVRDVRDSVLDKLTGFVPPDAGEVTLNGSVDYRKASTLTMPTLFIYEVAFSYLCNLSF